MTDTIVPDTRDNLLGVCAAIGEDFGINPLWLRIGFATALLFNLEAVLLSYVALGALVAISRLLFPNRKPAAAVVPLPVERWDVPADEPLAEEMELRQAA